MDFRPLNEKERRQLVTALRGNAEGDRVLLMDRRDTSFAGPGEAAPSGAATHMPWGSVGARLVGPGAYVAMRWPSRPSRARTRPAMPH